MQEGNRCCVTLLSLNYVEFYAQNLAELHNLELEEIILSNGTLLNQEIVPVLKSLNMSLMISLDGYGDYHDFHRPPMRGDMAPLRIFQKL